MRWELSRRLLLVSLTPTIVGCSGRSPNGEENPSDEKKDGNNESEPDPIDPACQLNHRVEQGQADPITVRAKISDSDTVDEDCALRAAEAAASQMEENLDVEFYTPWFQVSAKQKDSEYQPFLSIEPLVNEGHCPDPNFDFDEAISVLPSEVEVTDKSSGKTKCKHDIELTQQMSYID